MNLSDLRQVTLSRAQAALLLALPVVGLLCWLEARALASKQGSHAALLRQIEQMTLDTERIARLRRAPRLAAEAQRPNDELPAQVREAMSVAKIAPRQWIGNDPNRPVRVPKSPYKRLSVRLSFQGLTLRQLVQFAHNLTGRNPSLHIPHIRMHAAGESQAETWDIDLAVSYLIFSPYQSEIPYNLP